jgi:hypothetical protein
MYNIVLVKNMELFTWLLKFYSLGVYKSSLALSFNIVTSPNITKCNQN